MQTIFSPFIHFLDVISFPVDQVFGSCCQLLFYQRNHFIFTLRYASFYLHALMNVG